MLGSSAAKEEETGSCCSPAEEEDDDEEEEVGVTVLGFLCRFECDEEEPKKSRERKRPIVTGDAGSADWGRPERRSGYKAT